MPFRAGRTWLLGLFVALAVARSAPGQPPAPPEPAKPQVWAMLAGVERYEDSQAFPRCRGAARDAANLAHWLIDAAGWPADHVLLLSDRDLAALGFAPPAHQPEYRPATKANLDWGARTWLPSKARPGDTLVLFFAGQAVGLLPDPNQRPGAPDRDYLIPMDARGTDVDATGWMPGRAIEDVAARGDYTIVCLLDASPAGRVQSPRVLGSPAQFAPGERMLRGVVRWPGVTAWLAASDKPSGQSAEEGSGLLTQSLLASLGTRRKPSNLLECLDRLRREPSLASQRFRTSGGFRPDLSLWPADARPPRPKAEPLLQRGHADRVTAVSFAADGGRLYSASQDSTVRIWNAQNASLLRVMLATMNGVWSLAQSADGRLLAAGGGKGEVYIYDLTREIARTFNDGHRHRGPVEEVAFLAEKPIEPLADAQAAGPTPRHVVTLDNQGRCLVWDATRQQIQYLTMPAESKARLLAVAKRAGPVAFCLVTPVGKGAEVVQAFDALGKSVASLPVTPNRITALAIADDGGRVHVGREDGVVTEFELPGGAKRAEWKLNDSVALIKEAPLWLVAATDRTLHVLPRGEQAGRISKEVAMDGKIAQVALSADGRLVAACDAFRGELRVWELSDDGAAATPIEIERKDRGAALSLCFSPGGETLAAGDGDGGIRFWEIPAGRARPGIAASRGRVRHIAVAPDEKALLQINDDGLALVWEFGEGRGARRVPGSSGFRPAGDFLPDGDLALIDYDGNVVVHERATLARRPVVFERPLAENGRTASSWGFHSLAVGAGGRIAAGSRDGPLACVWKSADGRLACKPVRGHGDAINTVDLSHDGTSLLTGGDDGLVKVWNLATAEPTLERVLNAEGVAAPSPVTAAAFSPREKGLIAIGRKDGRLSLLQPGDAKPINVSTGLQGMVRTVAFSADGRLVAAAGDNRQITLFEADRPGLPILLNTRPSHFEMINTLVFWPQGKILASASDDTTVRLWRLADRTLIGTLAASKDGLDWVVFTPAGLFDASPEGERRVTWRLDKGAADQGEEVVARLDQLRRQRHVFDLADSLSQAKDVLSSAEIPAGKPPRIELEPVAAISPKQRRVDLAIRLSDPAVTDLRLYHNGVAVAGDLKPEDGTIRATVTLVGGGNQIYALAGKPGSIDARSNQLDLTYNGQTIGKTHVLALGVSRYSSQALRYADSDAQAIADALKPADPIVLLNENVSAESVNKAFEQLRREVRERPEDKVVVFLAGHTDVRQGYFCLLLPTAEMPTGGPEIVALRGVENNAAPQAQPPKRPPTQDKTLLPYALIHRNLSFVDALQRLVIVDACQAEAIFDDPIVRMKQRRSVRILADEDAYQARTSYIMAARRGERAGEAERLKHGLLTYALLRGIGQAGMGPSPDLPLFQQYPSADMNRDGWVETGELRQYADITVPRLAQTFPELVLRGARGDAPNNPRAAVAQESEQTSSFLLLETPDAAKTAQH
ncbi:MAG: caspase family protein [Paludisphaera borealis]|uniref:caspase family protein n=1 Tax=Paludisphaera borealis TaxID=1387353 RepID=UPI0028485144|nr:caspase family protein [Paludisphaera borealis]MDR3618400.1 caspase family protein [Paludisphaera borealis]